MPHFLKAVLVSSILVFIVSACATTEEASSSTSETVSDTPAWFAAEEFSSDSLSFYGYATAISSDSVIAAANARLQAKANLEVVLSENLEEIRAELEESGNSTVSETEFVLALRSAGQFVESRAEQLNTTAVSKENHFLGFAQVTISKADFRSLLNDGFSNSSYRSAFVESAAFQAFLN